MTVLWDGSNIHDRSGAVKKYLPAHPEIHTERLPPYAPETNPDENVWQHTKHGRLANFAPEDTWELRRVLIEEFDRLHSRPDLLAAFLRHAEIPVRLRKLSG
jgi:transposase